MSDSSTTVRSGGMGLLGWLTVIFVVLKFNPGGHLDSPVMNWSWWAVLAPTLIPLAILLVILVVAGVAFLVAHVHDKRAAKKRRAAFQARFNR